MTGGREQHPARNQKIRDMRAEGVGCREIARRMNISNNIVAGCLGRSGMTKNEQAKARDPDRNAQIIEMKRAGKRPMEIAREMSLTKQIVIGVLARAGMKSDPDEVQRSRQIGGRASGKAKLRALHDPAKAAAARRASLARIEQEAPHGSSLFESTYGCCWPFGEPRVGLTYCNAPCCTVKVPGLPTPQKTRYCVAHWLKRNATRHTRVIEDAREVA